MSQRKTDPNRVRTATRQAAARRRGRATPVEHAIVRQLALDQPGSTAAEALEAQAAGLALATRRDPATVRGWIAKAREHLQEQALRLAEIATDSAEGAFRLGHELTHSNQQRAYPTTLGNMWNWDLLSLTKNDFTRLGEQQAYDTGYSVGQNIPMENKRKAEEAIKQRKR